MNKIWWHNTLHSEVIRQYDLKLSDFVIFDISEYTTLAECRLALNQMYYAKLYEVESPKSEVEPAQEPTLRFTHQDGRVIEGSYAHLRANAKELLGISSGSVQKLKQSRNAIVKGWSNTGIVNSPTASLAA